MDVLNDRRSSSVVTRLVLLARCSSNPLICFTTGKPYIPLPCLTIVSSFCAGYDLQPTADHRRDARIRPARAQKVRFLDPVPFRNLFINDAFFACLVGNSLDYALICTLSTQILLFLDPVLLVAQSIPGMLSKDPNMALPICDTT